LGERVRYDGQHKLDSSIKEALSDRFELVPVCPELGAGFGVPREPMRLEGDPENPRLMTTQTHRDLTTEMFAWCAGWVETMKSENLRGFILKSRSPSCGIAEVDVFSKDGLSGGHSDGLFALALRVHFTSIPILDDEHFNDPGIRAEFISHILA
jgi:uncharacterized protein YbbK (DUF523 family)